MRPERAKNPFDAKSTNTFEEKNRVDVNNLIAKVRVEEKKNKKSSIAISVAALSAVTVFGIILTL